MKLVIVGNGIAGVTTARFVAEHDPSVEIVIYSDENYPYYPRPRLIDLLAGNVSPDRMALYDEDWYEKRGIRTVLNCRVADIKPEVHEIVLDGEKSERYDQLVLANGAHAWVPPIPGTGLAGVYTLRTMRDALALRARAQQAKHALVLGGGLLGLDTSMALRAWDIAVSVVEVLPRLLPRQLDAEGAGLLQQMIEDRGVEVITDELCTALDGEGKVEHAHLKGRRVIETDMVVISAGVRPNLDLAQGAGLACNRGVIVDQRLQTSRPEIYAVGDVAEFNERVWGIIPTGVAQARVAAAQIAGDGETLYEDIVPSTTLKVTGIDLTSIGEVNPEGDDFVQVRRIDPAKGLYKKLVVRGGHVVGAIVIGDRSDVRAINQLMSRHIDVSGQVDSLLDEGVDLMDLVRVQKVN